MSPVLAFFLVLVLTARAAAQAPSFEDLASSAASAGAVASSATSSGASSPRYQASMEPSTPSARGILSTSSAATAESVTSGYLPLLFEGRRVAVTAVDGASIDYRLGRDNLAFVNPGGVVRLGEMAGNCYTMAFVSKLFFEDARYEPLGQSRPESERRPVTMEDLATHLANGRSGKLLVHGYASLFDLTTDPEPASSKDLETRVHDELRSSSGLSRPTTGAAPLSPRMRAVVEMNRFITAVHYTFYVQRTHASFLASVAAEKLAPGQAPRVLTCRETESMKAGLRGGKTQLLCLWNNSIFFGHVILAYACAESSDADYFVCYDNNEQCGPERRPCIVRVARDGSSIRKFLREYDGSLSGGSGEACEELLNLPDLTVRPRDLADLERIVRDAGSATSFLMAASDLLESLTQRSPRASSLFDDVRRFILNLQSIHDGLGLNGIAKADRIGPNASVEEVNRLLEKYSALGARTAAPYGLPPGVRVVDTRVHFKDRQTACVSATLTVAPRTSARELARALEDGAALVDPKLANWLGTIRDAVGEEPLRAEVRFDLTKGSGECSVFKALKASGAPYGPVVELTGAHVVIGDLEPTRDLRGLLAVEVSERVARKALSSLLGRTHLVGPWHSMDSDTRVRVNSVQLVLDGNLTLATDAELFRAVTSADRGLSFRAPGLVSRLKVSRIDSDPPSTWRFQLSFAGRFSKADGVGGFANSLIGAWLGWNRDKLGEAMKTGIFQAQDRINGLMSGELKAYVDVVQPLDMNRGGYAHFDWTRGILEAFTPTASIGQGKGGELMLSFDKLESLLPGKLEPLRIRDIRFGHHRLLLTAEPRAAAGAD